MTHTHDDAVEVEAPSQETAQVGASDPIGGGRSALTDGTTGPAIEGERRRYRAAVARTTVFVLLPAVALLLACGIGWLKWWETESRTAELVGSEAVKAATDGTIALLSYQPDTVDKQLVEARDRLTGAFRDSYSSLTNDVVIPGAKQKHISAVASVPAAAAVSTNGSHAIVLVMVNQTTVIGTDSPTQTATSVKVSLDKVHGHWLISDFTPI